MTGNAEKNGESEADRFAIKKEENRIEVLV